MRPRESPDYEELRIILERELNKKISVNEARETGNFLINVYEVLLADDITNATISLDTT
jgi:hypothetical protein